MENNEIQNINEEERFNEEQMEFDEKIGDDIKTSKFFKHKDNEKTPDKKLKKKRLTGIITAFVLVVAVGVVGNWYYENSNISQTIQPLLDSATEKTLGKAELVDATTTTQESNYFSSARIERQTTRDSSIENLQSIINNADESETAKQDATEKLAAISGYMNMENKIETLVTAKGVNNCLAIINEDGTKVDVIVDADELSDSLVMQIKDIAISQVGCSFENVSIIKSK